MSAAAYPNPSLNTPPLTETERLLDTFWAPSKTFADIRRSASWWVPFLISVLLSGLFAYTVNKKVGWEQVTKTQIASQHAAQAQMDQMPPDQQQHAIAVRARITSYISYGYSLFGLVVAAIVAGVFMLTCNFGLGAREPFKRYFAVWMYGALPMALKALIAVGLLWGGVSAEGFDMQNIAGTNPGYFMDASTAPWLKTLLTSVDVFTIWSVILLTLGLSIVARVSRGAAAAVVCGWWALVVLLGVAAAAISS